MSFPKLIIEKKPKLSNKTIPLIPPVYDGTEPLYIYKNKLDAYMKLVKKEKYNIILKFLNELFEKDCKSLTEFKNIDMTNSNIKHFINIIKNHENIFNKKYKLEINNNSINEASEEEILEHTINIIKKLLYLMEYSIYKKKINDKYYYTIVNKPPNTYLIK
jgi:hypothetical protein